MWTSQGTRAVGFPSVCRAGATDVQPVTQLMYSMHFSASVTLVFWADMLRIDPEETLALSFKRPAVPWHVHWLVVHAVATQI